MPPFTAAFNNYNARAAYSFNQQRIHPRLTWDMSSLLVSVAPSDYSFSEQESQRSMDSGVLNAGFIPSNAIGAVMRPYQLRGVEWLIRLHDEGLGGILADEMGLGKTVQVANFLQYLVTHRGFTGPHLIVAPKSTLFNWERELRKWCPSLSVILLVGAKKVRQKLARTRISSLGFNICVTTFDLSSREESLHQVDFQCMIVDEAHKIKNVKSLVSKSLRSLKSTFRLLLTGTPFQNNVKEFFALVNFVSPQLFPRYSEFCALLDSEETHRELQSLLSNMILRRFKQQVAMDLPPKTEEIVGAEMNILQRRLYNAILSEGLAQLGYLKNVIMQLRKVCCHPYLFPNVGQPEPPHQTGPDLVQSAGKMVVLDRLLRKLRADGSRCLIFSQMTRMLDILGRYCTLYTYDYCRIDGGTSLNDRIAAIEEYNRPGSSKFVFLLTTRAAGVGINLTSADCVILYDSDWNPQMDLQAMDHAHRIGQTKAVRVYRLVTLNSIEEEMMKRAGKKLLLEHEIMH